VPRTTEPPNTRSAAQTRIVLAALDLFAEHGVNGTSLQMIADAIGVTKAAVYHQFPTKDEIVIAAVDVELEKLTVALDAADAEPDPTLARRLVLQQVIHSAVAQRRMISAVQHDPVIARHLARHRPFARTMQRLYAVLTANDPGVEARLRAAMVSAAVGGAVVHPLVADVDDETLRTELLRLAEELLDS
jgi:AcrR family transcriptional regulator